MTYIAGRYHDDADVPPHCRSCRETDGHHRPECPHWRPRSEPHEPEPCAEDCADGREVTP